MNTALTRLLLSNSSRRCCTIAAARHYARPTSVALISTVRRFSTDNITYSGGQATEGQGGFYGSGGARATDGAEGGGMDSDAEESRNKMLALAADVQKIQQVMDEYVTLENLLSAEDSDISNKSIELKSAIKKLMTSPEVLNALNRLEIHGEPVWGLSSEERELIILARDKVNEC